MYERLGRLDAAFDEPSLRLETPRLTVQVSCIRTKDRVVLEIVRSGLSAPSLFAVLGWLGFVATCVVIWARVLFPPGLIGRGPWSEAAEPSPVLLWSVATVWTIVFGAGSTWAAAFHTFGRERIVICGSEVRLEREVARVRESRRRRLEPQVLEIGAVPRSGIEWLHEAGWFPLGALGPIAVCANRLERPLRFGAGLGEADVAVVLSAWSRAAESGGPASAAAEGPSGDVGTREQPGADDVPG